MAIVVPIDSFLDENGNTICSGPGCVNVQGEGVINLNETNCIECEQFTDNPILYNRCRQLCKPPEDENQLAALLGISNPEQSQQKIKITIAIAAIIIAAIVTIYLLT